MSDHHDACPEEPKKRRGRRKIETALNNVVSLRVSDQERGLLEKITQTTSQSVSDVVREAIEFWLDSRRRGARRMLSAE